MRRCQKCGAEWISDKKQPGAKETCPECAAYLHCCLNCRFHELGVYNDCSIGTTEYVADKDGCNFCDEFEFAASDEAVAGSGTADEARSSFDSLFGASEHKKDQERLNDFKRLFGE